MFLNTRKFLNCKCLCMLLCCLVTWELPINFSETCAICWEVERNVPFYKPILHRYEDYVEDGEYFVNLYHKRLRVFVFLTKLVTELNKPCHFARHRHLLVFTFLLITERPTYTRKDFQRPGFESDTEGSPVGRPNCPDSISVPNWISAFAMSAGECAKSERQALLPGPDQFHLRRCGRWRGRRGGQQQQAEELHLQ